jgi:hypothetical protein
MSDRLFLTVIIALSAESYCFPQTYQTSPFNQSSLWKILIKFF